MLSLQCYPAKALFESFSVDADGLNQGTFERICPAIVEQIESKACVMVKRVEEVGQGMQSKSRGKSLLGWLFLQMGF